MKTTEKDTVARGRPRNPAKRTAILDAARLLFLGESVERMTMEKLAGTARVSTATLYAYFDNREDVLEAMVRRESELMLAEEWSFIHADVPFEQSLVDLGTILLRFLVDPELRAFERILSLAASKDVNLARRLLDAGPGRATLAIKKILEDADKREIISAPDLQAATNDLAGLWYGLIRLDLDYEHSGEMDEDFVRRRSEHGVRQFMRLYGRQKRARSGRDSLYRE